MVINKIFDSRHPTVSGGLRKTYICRTKIYPVLVKIWLGSCIRNGGGSLGTSWRVLPIVVLKLGSLVAVR